MSQLTRIKFNPADHFRPLHPKQSIHNHGVAFFPHVGGCNLSLYVVFTAHIGGISPLPIIVWSFLPPPSRKGFICRRLSPILYNILQILQFPSSVAIKLSIQQYSHAADRGQYICGDGIRVCVYYCDRGSYAQILLEKINEKN